jgi:hypothetical protein
MEVWRVRRLTAHATSLTNSDGADEITLETRTSEWRSAAPLEWDPRRESAQEIHSPGVSCLPLPVPAWLVAAAAEHRVVGRATRPEGARRLPVTVPVCIQNIPIGL